MTAIKICIGIPSSGGKGGGVTTLRRDVDGKVTVVSLARPWTPALVRNSSGTVTVTG